jgi:ElaB/YqjD/DUF883 family membrane-anchored ribosome-binding protein
MNWFILLSALGLSHRTSTANGRLRILQNGIEKMGTRAPANALRDTLDSLAEAVASAVELCGSLPPMLKLARHSAAFGKDAARYRTAALSQISKETEQRPLVAVAVALGIGILLGMAVSGRSRGIDPE